jgi:hypothetical protein
MNGIYLTPEGKKLLKIGLPNLNKLSTTAKQIMSGTRRL